jgi:hypothetical protein
MEDPVNTWSYFIAGYAVILLAILGYTVSLAVRWKNLKTKQGAIRKPEINDQTKNL